MAGRRAGRDQVMEGEPVPARAPGLMRQLARAHCHLVRPHGAMQEERVGPPGRVQAGEPRARPPHLRRINQMLRPCSLPSQANYI